MQFISTGSAPMSAAAMNFLKVACCAEVCEGVCFSEFFFPIANSSLG